jgi:hypothetical protein
VDVTTTKPGRGDLRLLLDARRARRLRIARTRKPVVVARLSRPITGGHGPQRLTMRLKSRARRALAHIRKVRLTLELRARDHAGATRTVTQALVLRR